MRRAAIVALAFVCCGSLEATAQGYCDSLFRKGAWTVSADPDRFTLYYPAFYQMSDHPNVTFEVSKGEEVWELSTPFFGDDPKPVVEVVVRNEATGETRSASVRDTHGESEFINVPLGKAGFPMGTGPQSVTVSVEGGEVATIEVDFSGFGDAYRLGKQFADREGARKRAGKCKSSGGGWW